MIEAYYIRAKRGQTQVVTTMLKRKDFEEVKSQYNSKIIEENVFHFEKEMDVVISKENPTFFHKKSNIKDSCKVDKEDKKFKSVKLIEAMSEGAGMCSNCFID
jgi:hypothetical protein